MWEFVENNDNSLTIDHQELGITKVLSFLEKNLEGFSLRDFDRMFKEGDVEDTLNIWKDVKPRFPAEHGDHAPAETGRKNSMKTFEFIWEKIWFSIFALFVGSFYGLFTSPIILYFFPQVKVMIVSTVVSIIFLAACFIFEDLPIKASVGIFYIITGFLIGGFLVFRRLVTFRDLSMFIMLGLLLCFFIVQIYKHFGSDRRGPAMFTLFGYISSNFTALICGKMF